MKPLSGILVAALLVAGCSSGSSSSSRSTSTKATTVTTAATTTTQDLAGDKQAASGAVIKAADAGPGFTGTAHDRTTDNDLGPCVNHDPILSGTTYPTEAAGDDLSMSSGASETNIQSAVRVAPTVEAAMASMAAIKATGVLTCLTDLFRTLAAASGVTISGDTLSPLTVPPIGDEAFGFKVVGNVSQSGKTVHTTGYAILVRKGRVLAQLSVDGLGAAPDLALATRLASTMGTRAGAIH